MKWIIGIYTIPVLSCVVLIVIVLDIELCTDDTILASPGFIILKFFYIPNWLTSAYNCQKRKEKGTLI